MVSANDCVPFFGRAHPLSNFYPCVLEIDGVRYSCVEHYMMAEKARMFGDATALREIMAEHRPLFMKRAGRRVKPFDAARWSEAAPGIVLRALRAKAAADPAIRALLLATGRAVIVEAAPRDRLWGAGLGRAAAELAVREGRPLPGRNMLGVLWMCVRRELQDAPEQGSTENLRAEDQSRSDAAAVTTRGATV